MTTEFEQWLRQKKEEGRAKYEEEELKRVTGPISKILHYLLVEDLVEVARMGV
jgi:hypothetical protein